jgi:hypothetical protein
MLLKCIVRQRIIRINQAVFECAIAENELKRGKLTEVVNVAPSE